MSGAKIQRISDLFKRFEGWHLIVERPDWSFFSGVYRPEQRGIGRSHPLGRFELALVSFDGEVNYVTVPVDIAGMEISMDGYITVLQFSPPDSIRIILRLP